MKQLWQSLIERLVYWITPTPIEILKPGTCECEHMRCSHKNGRGKCSGQWPPDEQTAAWTECSCLLFILDEDGDNEDDPETPSPHELERMLNV
jgi:hypothetical protein